MNRWEWAAKLDKTSFAEEEAINRNKETKLKRKRQKIDFVIHELDQMIFFKIIRKRAGI